MALAYSAAVQTRIASLLGLNYSSTSTFNKTVIDGSSAADPPAGGVALDAYTQIQQFSQWITLAAPSVAPSEWEGWLVARAAMMAARVIHPTRVAEFQRNHAYAEAAAFDAYARNLITYDPGATPEASVLTLANIRKYVVANLVRRSPGWQTINGEAVQRPREFVPFEIIDAHAERVMRRIWQYGDWPFARRRVRMTMTRYAASDCQWTAATKTLTSAGSNFAATIPNGATVRVTAGTGATLGDYIAASATATTLVLKTSLSAVDLTAADIAVTVIAVSFVNLISSSTAVLSENFAAFASRRVFFDDSSSQGANYMEWFKDSDEIARRKAYDQAGGTTGRPRYFSYTDNSGNLTWDFHPFLDQTYTGQAVVLIKGPTLDTLANTTTSLARFPAEFSHVIKDAVLAETLRHLQDPLGEKLWEQVNEEIQRMLPVYCDPGAADNDSLESRDVYNDLASFTGGTNTLGGWM